MALTEKGIRALKPKEKAYRVSDKGGIRGLNIRVLPAGRKVWVLRYSDASGKERFYTIGEYPAISLGEARESAAKLKAKVREEGALVRQRADAPAVRAGTVKDLLAGYVADLRDRGAATADQVEQRLARHVIPLIGERIANEVTEEQINTVLAEIYSKGHRVMANRVRGYLLTAWKWGRRHDRDYRYQRDGITYGIQHNPVVEIPRDAAAERIDDRVLSWHEIRMLWHACSDVISLPIRLVCSLNLALGGHRSGEILGIRDEELDLSERLWRMPAVRTKNGKANIVPLNDVALAIIEQARLIREAGPYLFPRRGDPEQPTRVDSYYTAIRRYCERTPGEPWTPKDLRTTFKTRGGEAGLSKEIRDRIQNHALTDVASRHYDMWDYVPEKREAMERWGRRLREEIGGIGLSQINR